MEGMTPTRSDVHPDGPAAVIELIEPSLDRLPGYAVAPWKRRRGYATRALVLLPPVVRKLKPGPSKLFSASPGIEV